MHRTCGLGDDASVCLMRADWSLGGTGRAEAGENDQGDGDELVHLRLSAFGVEPVLEEIRDNSCDRRHRARSARPLAEKGRGAPGPHRGRAMARITAERLVEQLRLSGFVLMKRPPARAPGCPWVGLFGRRGQGRDGHAADLETSAAKERPQRNRAAARGCLTRMQGEPRRPIRRSGNRGG